MNFRVITCMDTTTRNSERTHEVTVGHEGSEAAAKARVEARVGSTHAESDVSTVEIKQTSPTAAALKDNNGDTSRTSHVTVWFFQCSRNSIQFVQQGVCPFHPYGEDMVPLGCVLPSSAFTLAFSPPRGIDRGQSATLIRCI